MPPASGGEAGHGEVGSFVDQATILRAQRDSAEQLVVHSRPVQKRSLGLRFRA